jgi:hypothetical protein
MSRLRTVFGLVLFSLAATAQTAQITGRVTDPSGAVVSSAEVSATSVSTGTSYAATSNNEGYYTVASLEPGTYRISVRHPGFKPVIRSGVVLQVDQAARIDFALQVGDVTESVQITADAPLVESETSSLGQVVNNKAIVEIPLNGRNAWDLTRGVGATVFIRGAGDAGEIPLASMAGGRTWSQSLMLDGGSVQKSGLARAQAELSPMVDAVEEFKVITNNYAAEYGRTAAGVFTAVTRSGTNQIRGTLFEFFRNDALDARNFFALDRAPLRYNQFGGTLGGPIRRDRTHFFTALETTKVTRGSTVLLTVPTAAQKQGVFTGLRDAQGRGLQLYNPFTTRPDPADRTRQIRDPFPNNVIPANLMDPVALKALSFYPEPNLPGNAAGANNFNINVAAKRTQYHGTARVDHVLTNKDRLFLRYVAQHNTAPQANVYAEPAASGAGPNTRNISNLAHTWLASWVRTVSPSLLNDFKYSGINQNRFITHASVGGNWPEKLGLTGVGQAAFPIFRPQGYSLLGSPNTFRSQTNPGWQILEALSYYRGNHSVKAGVEYRSNRTTDEFDRMPAGDFTFAQQGTGVQGNALTGNGLASMLLGFATNAVLNDAPDLAFSSYYVGLYVQDDWKLTSRLTLNLGVRYDVEPGRIADNNTQNGFALDRIHPIARVPGVVTFAGIDGEPVRIFNTDRNNIAPRLGFAWRPFGSDRTVLRGGAGLFYGNPDDQGYSNTAVLGFSTEVQRVSPDQNQTPALLLRNGFTGIQAPGPADRTDAFGINSPVNFYQRERATPYSIQYNFGVQHEVRSTLISTQYIANLGRKLTAGNLEMNQVHPSRVGGAGSIQSRRPFPHFTSVQLVSPNLGHSSYHAGLLRVEKRYNKGLQFLFNYTWSKFLDNVDALGDFGGTPGAGYQDYYNRRLDKALSSNDVAHNASLSFIYDLPFGPGRTWLGAGALSQILGGWQLSTLATVQSGPPYGVVTQQNTCECFSAGPQRANILRNPELPSGERTVERWFDTSAFAQPARFAFGDAARSVGHAPGLVNFDVGIMKNFTFAEHFRLQFRGELFNAFNRANFGIPGTALGSPQFGAINNAADARVAQLGLKMYF